MSDIEKQLAAYHLLQKQIAEILKQAKIPFKTEVAVQGIKPDFVFNTPDGRLVAIEAKAGHPDQIGIQRALKQVKLLKQATGFNHAFAVFPEAKIFDPEKGVISVNKLSNFLSTNIIPPPPSGKKVTQPPVPFKPERLVFAAMPFSPEYEDVFHVAMAPACASIKAVCRPVNQEQFIGDIPEKIHSLIQKSVAGIADLSESNPNVLYETGYAHALGRPTIQICSTPLEKLPFDVRNLNTIPYTKGQTHKLKVKLESRLKAILRL